MLQENNRFFQSVVLDNFFKAQNDSMAVMREQIAFLQQIVSNQNQQIIKLTLELAKAGQKAKKRS